MFSNKPDIQYRIGDKTEIFYRKLKSLARHQTVDHLLVLNAIQFSSDLIELLLQMLGFCLLNKNISQTLNTQSMK